MTLIRQTSPHTRKASSTQAIMLNVLIALIPGLLVSVYFFGWGVLINLVWASLVAVGCEALIIKLRKRPIRFFLQDYTAVVTAALLALAIPPSAPWWLTLIGTSFAIIIGKHLYGGMGQNLFNPAMLGYVLLLVSFPLEMSAWLPALGVREGQGVLDLMASIQLFAGSVPVNSLDAMTMATPLDILRENTSLTIEELWATNPVFSDWAGKGWQWVSLAYMLGGCWLLYKRVFTWHAPAGMLLMLGVMATLFYGGEGSDSHGSPLFHWLSGATMLGAFFIITDPVTSAASNKGRFIFGAGIGALTYIIRTWGGYPDGVAFAVLLMNMAAPTIDYYTQPRTYGHKKPNRGLAKPD